MVKIIGKDNSDRDGVSDILVESGLDQATAEQKCKELNKKSGPNANRFYVVVSDDYKLYKFEP